MKNSILLIILAISGCHSEGKQDLTGGWQFQNGGMYWEIYIKPDTIFVFNSDLWMIVDVSYQLDKRNLSLSKNDYQILNGIVNPVNENQITIEDNISGKSLLLNRIDGSQRALKNMTEFEDFLSNFQRRYLDFSRDY